MGVLSDISAAKQREAERKELERALQASETKVRDILNSTLAAIASMRIFPDGTWYIDHVSEGCELISGYTATELTEQQTLWLELIEPGDWQQIEPQVFSNVFAGKTGTYEYRLHHKDGSLQRNVKRSAKRPKSPYANHK